jgi:plastocyanin
MRLTRFFVALFGLLLPINALHADTEKSAVTGVVTFKGIPIKSKPLDLSKEPVCVKMHSVDPLLSETLVTGPGNALANVVVYVSAGEAEPSAGETNAVTFDQKGCHYTTHVLAIQAGQEIKISNSDPISHNIHPMAKVNREWNRIQPPATPAFSYAYDKEEFIPVKCNLHPWMQGYFVVVKTSHFAVTGENGKFRLPDLPPGNYTITAWHESMGTLRQEIKISPGETKAINFAFPGKF